VLQRERERALRVEAEQEHLQGGGDDPGAVAAWEVPPLDNTRGWRQEVGPGGWNF